MALRLAINGCGRIGRNILRAQLESPRADIDIVMVNDLADIATTAHLLTYDSIHGMASADIGYDERISSLQERKLPIASNLIPPSLIIRMLTSIWFWNVQADLQPALRRQHISRQVQNVC